jgi:hypothetical protein
MSILAQFIGLPDFGQSQSEKENSKGDVGSRISLKSAKLNTIHEDKGFTSVPRVANMVKVNDQKILATLNSNYSKNSKAPSKSYGSLQEDFISGGLAQLVNENDPKGAEKSKIFWSKK